MKKTILISALSLILLLSACGVQPAPAARTETPVETGSAPTAESAETETEKTSFSNFKAVDLDGNEVDESIFADHDLTMINIWATFCGPCINEMPELGELAAEYADKGVRVVGIVADVRTNSDGSFSTAMIETAKELVKDTGADYLHLLPTDDLYKAKLDEVSAVPETVFVDSEGKLVGKSYVGSRSGDKWAKIIEELLPMVQA